MNPDYLKDSFKSNLKDHKKEKTSWKCEDTQATFTSFPFPLHIHPNFILDLTFLKSLEEELGDIKYLDKNNDLYKFQQSKDLSTVKSTKVKKFRNLFTSEIHGWLKDLSGIDLNNKIDLTSSKYTFTDTLLCHDDELDERRIAFILYLVPPWDEEDGGSLNQFTVDDVGQPKDIYNSIKPEYNTFVWFEVTPISFHQVSEVLSREKCRLSVNGWFNGPSIIRSAPFIHPPPKMLSYSTNFDNELLVDWINPLYLNIEVQGQIQTKFENESEIELTDFLKNEKYESLINCLKEKSLVWTKTGPPNKRSYYKASEETYPFLIQQFVELLKSESFFLILSNLTGLRLHPLAPSDDSSDSDSCKNSSDEESGESSKQPSKKLKKSDNSDDKSKSICNPCCYGELRQWKQGCYTLLHDSQLMSAEEFVLDVNFFCNCDGWKSEFGGFTSYIVKGEDEELLTINPNSNSLALVYRDKDSLKFVKYINSKILESKSNIFYDFNYTYSE